MVKKEQWKNYREGNPDPQLLVDGQVGENTHDKKSRHRDQHRSGVIDVDRADEIALLPFEHEAAMRACHVHSEKGGIQRSDAAARAFEAQPISQHRYNAPGHIRR
jgi:hypothetical protein